VTTAVFATSRYTFRLPLEAGFALYNASTGAVLRLDGPDADELSALLAGPRAVVEADALPPQLLPGMRRNGFLVDPGADELEPIRERYWAARGDAPIVLLVTTTMDCNLGCYYCYESRSSDTLRTADAEGIVAIARERLERQGKTRLHVDWYGGEPLLNLEFLEAASLALQRHCAAAGVTYHASAISNGTCWPDAVGDFVRRHALRQVQISFDGLRDNHDKRRRYRRDYRPSAEASSFDRAVGLVDQLLEHTRVDVRFNVDPGNMDDFAGFVAMAKSRGWFDAPFRCVVMPARLQAFSDRSAFMRRREVTDEEFDAIEEHARCALPPEALDAQDVVDGFPFPRTSVCGALADDSAVVGADGLEYRCGLQVGERHRAVGRFGSAQDDESFPDADWWKAFDPTTRPTCSRCSFLPVCWGGCPKRHLDDSRADLDREGRFWRHYLPRQIAAGFGERPPTGFAYSPVDQFRDGAP
jgi:uncharacterized protein